MTGYIELAPAWAREMYRNISRQLGEIMSKVTVESDDLAALKDELTSIATDLETELAALNVPAGDLTGVKAVVDRLRSDVLVPAPAPTPTPDPTPAPDQPPTP